ncbi:DUF262 domain-containing protein [Microcoleus sp. FACHB-1515]|uniref:GmrSD restriction endonuclease domain-containing protein n=1 Tax=Cyanophyceae TaxID=3028117 RepID=UPI001682F145|nr:DUF262 domain-containing protein [Microcoleus sp. FACHB-1515]MBD2090680.1 DUF262 domain-containing protein [Microcoleus sp. FACHB-1515]
MPTNIYSTFDITKECLPDFLSQIRQGIIQIPDLQRSFCWEDSFVRKLLANVSRAWPFGAVLLLETGNAQSRFKSRLVEGVQLLQAPDPTKLILDGQQRLTTLSMALAPDQPVAIRDKKSARISKHWYYIDIAKALDPHCDRQAAILSLPESRIKSGFGEKGTIDCSSRNREYELGLFPSGMMFHYSAWRSGYCKFWHYATDKLEVIDRFEQEIIKKYEHYHIPVILLRPVLPKAAVCELFEDTNTQSMSLNFFELVTSSYAGEDFSIRDDWEQRSQRLSRHPVLSQVRNTDFLQAVTLTASVSRRRQAIAQGVNAVEKLPGVGCGRVEVLKLELEDYQRWAEPVAKGFEEAARFLYGLKIVDAADIAYAIQLVALVCVLVQLGEWNSRDSIRQKLEQWFWSGLFGEMYTGAHEHQATKDALEVPAWILADGSMPNTIADSSFSLSRLQSVRRRHGAVFRGLSVLLRRHGAIDLASGELLMDVKAFDDPIESHHLFPVAYSRQHGIGEPLYNSLVNRTPLSFATNRLIGGKAPSAYLAKLEQHGISRQRLDTILESHWINPTSLWHDDFDSFFALRSQALLQLVGQAMGRSIE